MGLLRFPPTLRPVAMKSFPSTRIFNGEIVPAGGKMRYPRFMRAGAYRPIWERLAAKLPIHKLYLCMETRPVWKGVDANVASNSCIEKRVCNMEFIDTK
jgi:spore photoproduct lyase